MADKEKGNPGTKSSEYEAQIGYWTMVNAILCGVEAMRAVAVGNVAGPPTPFATLQQLNRGRFGPESPYLPRFPNENAVDYDRRRRTAFLTNVYGDISRTLASKPFSKLFELAEDSGEDLKKLAENIDGLGNNLHVFGRQIFKAALDKGITWVLVDFTKVPPGATLAAERDMGARPYFVHVPAELLNAVYSKFINGKEIIFHACIDESCTELDGYEEIHYRRVRELNRDPIVDAKGNVTGFGPASWKLWQEETSKDDAGKEEVVWVLKDAGPITIGFIPLVPVILGERHGGTSWKVEPPLRDLAYMQVKLFQQESNLDAIKELTAFPMLAGNGVPVPLDGEGAQIEVPVGPRAVLFAPAGSDGNHGEWKFVEPAGSSLTFLQSENEKTRTEMRDLGMQPLATQNITIVTSKNVSLKAHSAVQAWSLRLKDAAEQMWKFVCIWLGQKDVEPTVNVHTDFGVELEEAPELDALSKAEAASVISKRLYFNELKRRGVLADDADWDDDQEAMAEQQQGLEAEQPIDPRTGLPLTVDPATGRPITNTANAGANGMRPPLQ